MRSRAFGGVAILLGSPLILLAMPFEASATVTTFGAILTNESQPANAGEGYPCGGPNGIPEGANCTWVAVTAYHNGSHAVAPKNGTIGSIKLVSCVAGSFRLEFARVGTNRAARIVRKGPTIHYKADPQTECGGDNGDNYLIQTFKVNVHVNKGDYLAIETPMTGAISCSGGSGVLLFNPVLPISSTLKKATDTASCNLLIRLYYTT
jgi:hypothetical protein